MYTLLELESKTFEELKKIGSELDVLPEGDRRRRESWINAIAGVNPPLLPLLENSPAEDVQAQESPIIETVEASPAAQVEPVQETPLESKFGRIVYPRSAQGAISQVAKNSPGVEVDPVEDQQLPECVECFDDGFVEDESGVVKLCNCGSDPKLSRQKAQSAIAPAAKNLPGSRSKTSTAHQLLELFKSSAHIIEDAPGVKTEATVSESAIEPAAKHHLDQESDQNPILTGIALSDRFVARYSPPQPENILFKSEADGQLSLLDFEVQSQPEPPDPDDFESLDAFREAIALWDWEHPSSSDHCSVHCEPSSVHCEPSSVHCEPSSVHCEPPDPYDFDSMFAFWAAYDAWGQASDNDSEPSSIDKLPSSIDKLPSSIYKPLEVSIDSFCEWALCPEDWYEPHTLIEPSKVMELSPTRKNSDTSDFFIPTFGRLGDRLNGSDEPPDTGGIFARLPKPKPPSFPPQASQPKSGKVSLSQSSIPKLSRNYPETIPKLFPRVVAGSSTQPARSPPGGDA